MPRAYRDKEVDPGYRFAFIVRRFSRINFLLCSPLHYFPSVRYFLR
jgi:hypothetical protein